MKSAKDCPVIEMLKAQVCIGENPFNGCLLVQGALPFCLTNIPQTMVSCKHLGWSVTAFGFRSALVAATPSMVTQRTRTTSRELPEDRLEGRCDMTMTISSDVTGCSPGSWRLDPGHWQRHRGQCQDPVRLQRCLRVETDQREDL